MKADLELVREAQSGDRQSFSQLVEKHQRTMMRVALRITKDFEFAEDVVQDSFIKAFEKLDSFEGRSSFRSWMYQITMNTAKNKLRGLGRETSGLDHVGMAAGAQSENQLAHRDLQNYIRALIDDLPERQKTAITLRIFEDLSFREVADIMGCPYDTAKANYRHALLKIKEQVEKNDEFKTWKEMDGETPSLCFLSYTEAEI